MDYSEKIEQPERRRRRSKSGPRWMRRIKRRIRTARWGIILLVIVTFLAAVIVAAAALVADSSSRVQASIGSLNRVLATMEQKPRNALTLDDFNRLDSSVDDLAGNLGRTRSQLRYLQWARSLNATVNAANIQLDAAHNLARAGQEILDGLQPTLFFLVAGDDSRQVVAQISSGQRVVELLEVGQSSFLEAGRYLDAARVAIDQLDFETLSPDLAMNTYSLEQFYSQLVEINSVLRGSPELLTSALGLDEERSYIVLSQNSDEIRPSGGYVSTFGWLTVRNGRITSYSYSPTTASSPNPPPPGAVEFEVPDWWINYSQPVYAAWDGSWYVDFPSTAEMAMWYYNTGNNPQSPVDGVIAIDTAGFEQVMSALGQVIVPGYEIAVTSENFREVVYNIRTVGEGEVPHKRFLAALYQQIFNDWQLASADPTLSTLLMGEVLESLQQKHMMLYFADESMNNALDALNWSGRQAPARTHDYLLIADANMGNKSNRSVMRQLTYDVDIQPDGGLNSRTTITYDYPERIAASDPAVNEAYHGPLDYVNLLQVFTPAGSQIETTDNVTLPPQVVDSGEHTNFVSQVTVDYDTSERFQYEYTTPPLIERVGPYMRYRLLIQKQPGMLQEAVNVQVTLPANARTFSVTPAPVANYALDRPIVEFRFVLNADQWVEIIYEVDDEASD